MSPEAWGAIGLAITGVLGYLGVRFTASQADRAKRSTDATTDRRDAVDGYDKLTARLEARLDGVEKRLRTVEADLISTTRVMRVALAYVERLLDFIAEHVPGKPLPPVPTELTEHLPAGLLEDWRTPPTATRD